MRYVKKGNNKNKLNIVGYTVLKFSYNKIFYIYTEYKSYFDFTVGFVKGDNHPIENLPNTA